MSYHEDHGNEFQKKYGHLNDAAIRDQDDRRYGKRSRNERRGGRAAQIIKGVGGLALAVAAGAALSMGAIKGAKSISHETHRSDPVLEASGDLHKQEGISVNGKVALDKKLQENPKAVERSAAMQRRSEAAAIDIADMLVEKYKQSGGHRGEHGGHTDLLKKGDLTYSENEVTIHDYADQGDNQAEVRFGKDANGKANFSDIHSVSYTYAQGKDYKDNIDLHIYRAEGGVWATVQDGDLNENRPQVHSFGADTVEDLNQQTKDVDDALRNFTPNAEPAYDPSFVDVPPIN